MPDITEWRTRIAKCFADHNMDDEGNDIAPEKFGEADIEYFDTKAVINKLEALLQQVDRESREIYVPVHGTEGRYEVSNFGNVKSVAGGRRKGGILKQSMRSQKFGYKVVTLCKGKLTQTVNVHRLVAVAFLSNPDNKRTVNHKDGNKLNNNVENLEWATRQQQSRNTRVYKTSKTGIKGVTRSRSSHQWRAYVCVDKQIIWLGYYYTLAEAKEARLAGERKYYGADNEGVEDELTPWIRRIVAAAVYTGTDDHEDVRSILKTLLRRVEVEARQTDEYGNPIIQLNMYEAEAVAHLIKNSDPARFDTGGWFHDIPFKIEKRLAELKALKEEKP